MSASPPSGQGSSPGTAPPGAGPASTGPAATAREDSVQVAAGVVSVLQAALAAEHAAVYGYGIAGAHLTGQRMALALRYWGEHQAARDRLTAMITARGAAPAAAAAAYALPFSVRTAQAAVSLATLLEDRVTTAYLGMVALTDPALRTAGARAVRSAALRAAAWRGHTVAFPGLAVSAARRPAAANAADGTP
jgi:hypothetical protein